MTTSSAFDGPRLLRWDEEAASRRLSHMCFGGGGEDGPDVAADQPSTQTRRRKKSDGEWHVIASQGRPVSQIGIFTEILRVFDGIIRIGSIGGVCTHPDFRGYGLASRLLDHCARRLVGQGARLMLISGGRGLYTRAGCVPAGRHAAFHLRRGADHLPDRGTGLRALIKEDALAGSRLYQRNPVHFERRLEQYAASFGRPPGGFHAEERMVMQDGAPAAYLLLTIPWEFIRQPELGIREVFEYAGSRVALADGLASMLREPGIQEVRVHVPWQDADLIHLLGESGLQMKWRALPDHTLRILNFPGLMRDLRPYLRARLEPALLRGLRFEQSGPLLSGEGGDRTAGGDNLSIVRGAERLTLNGAGMTRVVMGAPDGASAQEVGATGAVKEIIEILFPLPSFLPGMSYH